MTSLPHSALYLSDARDLWWNGDFLQLIARRFQLETVHAALDVGCGRGHWTSALATVLPDAAQITGVDREPHWVEAARKRLPQPRFEFETADALALPFPDANFDLVTCQTLLIHIDNPERALREMLRVTRPGGVLLCAEPNNVATNLAALVTGPNVNLDDLLAFVRLQYTCERGKHALGRGFNSIGETLPSTMRRLGLCDLQVYVNDRTNNDDAAGRITDSAERERLRGAPFRSALRQLRVLPSQGPR
jgi:SAM-dependent methyltransferase